MSYNPTLLLSALYWLSPDPSYQSPEEAISVASRAVAKCEVAPNGVNVRYSTEIEGAEIVIRKEVPPTHSLFECLRQVESYAFTRFEDTDSNRSYDAFSQAILQIRKSGAEWLRRHGKIAGAPALEPRLPDSPYLRPDASYLQSVERHCDVAPGKGLQLDANGQPRVRHDFIGQGPLDQRLCLMATLQLSGLTDAGSTVGFIEPASLIKARN